MLREEIATRGGVDIGPITSASNRLRGQRGGCRAGHKTQGQTSTGRKTPEGGGP